MRPVYLFGSFKNDGLGQSRPLTGISMGYNEASQWLADAEKIVSGNPACNLPIVDTVRQFVNGTASVDRLGARLDLNPADMQSLADFKQCQVSQPAAAAQAAAAAALAAQAAADKRDQIVGISVAGVVLLGASLQT